MIHGKTLKIFVRGHDPRALQSVELINWTGQAFLGRREHRRQIKKLPELAEPGVYLLLSEPHAESGAIDFYVGEAEDFLDRLDDHYRKKDWWTRFIVFVSKDKNLTKAHVRYLEKQIFDAAQNTPGILKVHNKDKPSGSSLPLPDQAAMHEFFQNLVFVLETLGLSYFSTTQTATLEARRTSRSFSEVSAESFFLTLPRDLTGDQEKYGATLEVQSGSYVLKSGSYVRKEPRPSFVEHSYFNLWRQISNSSKVQDCDHPKLLQTCEDIEFRAPSAAAAVVRAGQTNGRLEWKRFNDGCSLGEWEDGLGDVT